jgi:hypothetical protein
VTPPELTPWSKIVMMQASHFNAAEAYAAIDRHRLEDNEPYIYRTRDGGKTWQRISNGLPAGVYLQTVKEDPIRQGLLFAGTELGVFVSFNDGDAWQSLQLNLPPASMRDLAIHGDDLIVATHGRGFWVLDDISPLRQMTKEAAQSRAHLFRPSDAMRMNAGNDYASPMPRDEALADNPPTGAMIDYYLKSGEPGPLVIEILDAKGQIVRRYSSDDHARPVKPDALQFPAFWKPAPQPPSAAAGMHRWIWDLQYTPVEGAIRFDDDELFAAPRGILALPGAYTVQLTVAGQNYSQPLTVKMDPRIKVSSGELQKQFDAATEVSRLQSEISEAQRGAQQLLSQAQGLHSQAQNKAALLAALDALIQKTEDIAGPPPGPYGIIPAKPTKEQPDLSSLATKLAQIFSAVNNGDAAPTADAMQAFDAAQADVNSVIAKWKDVLSEDLPSINSRLKHAGLAPIVIGQQGPQSSRAPD